MTAVSLVTWAVTKGLPSRSAPTQLPKRRNAGTADAAGGACAGGRPPPAPPGLIERAVQGGRHDEERLVERGHDCAHLVDRLHGLVAQRRREPQQVDLLSQPAPDLGLVG